MLASLLFAIALPAAPELMLPTGHTGSVTTVAFSPDGDLLATSSLLDSTTRLWESATGRELRTWRTDGGGALAFVAADRLVALHTPNLIAFDVRTGAELARAANVHHVRHLALSPDGRTLAGAGYGGMLALLDARTLAVRSTVRVGTAPEDDGRNILDRLAWSPDGKRLAVPARDGTVSIVAVRSGKVERRLTAAQPMQAVFSTDGKQLYVAGERLQVFDTRTWTLRADEPRRGWTLAVEPRGGRLVLAKLHSVESVVLDADGRRELGRLPCAGDHVAWSPRGDTIACTVPLSLHDAATLERRALLGGAGEAYAGGALSSDGARMIAWRDERVALFPLGAGVTGRALEADGAGGPWSAVHFAVGSAEVLGVGPATVTVWDTVTGARRRRLAPTRIEGHATGGPLKLIGASAPVRDGLVFVCGFGALNPQRLCHWDFQTGALRAMGIVKKEILQILPAASGATALLRSYDQLQLWDLRSEAVTVLVTADREPNGYRHSFEWAAADATGSVAAVAHGNGVSVFDLGSGGRRLRIDGYGTRAAVDLQRGVVLVGNERGLMAAELATGREIWRRPTDASALYSLAFTPDGRSAILRVTPAVTQLRAVDDGRLLATHLGVSVAGGDWVAVTADGRFDGTDAGTGVIHWVDGITPVTLDALFDRFFTPALIPQALAGTLAPLAAVSIASPPTVELSTEPLGPGRARVHVKAADTGGGVGELRLYQNGKRVADDVRGFVRAGARARAWEVLLAPGRNVFAARATSRDGTESPAVELVLEEKGPAPEATLWIFAVGINTYANPKYALNYGRPDAEAFSAAVERRGRSIFKDVQKTLLIDGAATRGGIEAGLARIAGAAKPQDALVLFFAGHGVMSEGAGASPEFFFAPADVTQLYGDDAGLAARALSATRLREILAAIPAQKQLVVLDACESGGAVQSFAVRGAREEKAMAQLARSAGVVVLAATQSTQVATELQALGHGVFTYAMLQGLDGAGDLNKDGRVTVKELEAHLNDSVPALTQKHRGIAQYPNSFARGQDFPIAVIP